MASNNPTACLNSGILLGTDKATRKLNGLKMQVTGENCQLVLVITHIGLKQIYTILFHRARKKQFSNQRVIIVAIKHCNFVCFYILAGYIHMILYGKLMIYDMQCYR